MMSICVMIKHDGGQNDTSISWDKNLPVYGARMLFAPKRKLNLKKYMLWSDSLHLMDTKYFICCSFNYDVHDDIIKPKQHIALSRLEFLLSFCNQLSIVTFTLFTLTVRKSSLKQR